IFTCPVCGRVFERTNKDGLFVHIAFHCMEGKAWCCQGVPKEEAAGFGIPPETRGYIFLGRERVGGCLRTFFDRNRLDMHLSGRFNTC
ncbi:hypothetical protein B0H11DRAFT_1644819, partial [Mycena galericulata]